MQQALEAVYADDSLFPSSPDGVPVQSGAVLLDPKTGGVKALVGGRGRHVFRGFNRATELRRQPGSTLKPLAVYTPALEQGYGPFSPLKDEPLDFGGYRPQNYDHTYRGTVTMYEAIIHSLNVPAVWLLNEIGLDKGMEALHRFGLPLEKRTASSASRSAACPAASRRSRWRKRTPYSPMTASVWTAISLQKSLMLTAAR
ncbi:penicillin-binding transpeptidase domain-containing protein [Geobacillus zalihae]|uniref:penicillin-binding transpeptidase domain-containing protein n=1 Tax=Geobacillus zalihae TaxID=213419 RepID=UPI0021E08D49|nr:penicillin-binding transpeptidase domain-containing protein [Geobacillus zalihae]